MLKSFNPDESVSINEMVEYMPISRTAVVNNLKKWRDIFTIKAGNVILNNHLKQPG